VSTKYLIERKDKMKDRSIFKHINEENAMKNDTDKESEKNPIFVLFEARDFVHLHRESLESAISEKVKLEGEFKDARFRIVATTEEELKKLLREGKIEVHDLQDANGEAKLKAYYSTLSSSEKADILFDTFLKTWDNVAWEDIEEYARSKNTLHSQLLVLKAEASDNIQRDRIVEIFNMLWGGEEVDELERKMLIPKEFKIPQGQEARNIYNGFIYTWTNEPHGIFIDYYKHKIEIYKLLWDLMKEAPSEELGEVKEVLYWLFDSEEIKRIEQNANGVTTDGVYDFKNL
jgi:hypothetical protein